MKGPVNRRSSARGYRTLLMNASLLPIPYLLCLPTHTLLAHSTARGQKPASQVEKYILGLTISPEHTDILHVGSADQNEPAQQRRVKAQSLQGVPAAEGTLSLSFSYSLSPSPVQGDFVFYYVFNSYYDPLTRPQLKCDAHLDYSKPCSRCRALGIDCVFTANFKRRKFRPYAAIAPFWFLTAEA